MIHRVVLFALRQRFMILIMAVLIAAGGAVSFEHMPVDAYPDLSPPMVEIITQWPGHAAEEVERLVSLPTEVEMNGVPKMSVMRSISLYGLSDVRLTFAEDTDDYFARQIVFQRLSDVTYPSGVMPSLSPLTSPSGLVYRYVIESPDRSPQELKTFEDWVIERGYKQVPGVADDSGFGGTVMQYQVLLDPARLYGYHITVPQVLQQLSVTVQPVLQDLELELEEAAATLGATHFQTFVRVTAPALMPAIITGFTLAFARALGEYGSVVFISGNMPMRTEVVPLLIMSKLEQFDYQAATAIALVMLVLSFALLFGVNLLQRLSTDRYAA